MREMAPIGEMAPGCAKKYNIKKPVRTRCHLTHDYGILVVRNVINSRVGGGERNDCALLRTSGELLLATQICILFSSIVALISRVAFLFVVLSYPVR